MDILKKVETLINATARGKLPRRERRSVLDEDDDKVLAEIRQALRQVEAQEQILAKRIREEQIQADEAADRGDRTNQRHHERRANELEAQLKQEFNLEDKLAALEEKLARAKAAVEREGQKVAERDEAASKVIDRYTSDEPVAEPAPEPPPSRPKPRRKDMSARKSRLSR